MRGVEVISFYIPVFYSYLSAAMAAKLLIDMQCTRDSLQQLVCMFSFLSLSLSLSQVQFPGCVCGVRDHHTGSERGRHPHWHFRPKDALQLLKGPGGELQRVHYFPYQSRLADIVCSRSDWLHQ